MRNNILIHHGILGQKWGIRRYQNPDGSLTPKGQKRQLKQDLNKENKTNAKLLKSSLISGNSISNSYSKQKQKIKLASKYVQNKGMSNSEALKAATSTQRKRAAAYVTALGTATTLAYLMAIRK